MQPSDKTQSPFQFYQSLIDSRSPDELRTIAHIKRFTECLGGDPEFRDILTGSPDAISKTFKERGIDLDWKLLTPFWEYGLCLDIADERLERFPLSGMWVKWIKDLMEFRNLMRIRGDARSANKRFNAWRQRQIARCNSEIGDTKHVIIHSTLAFELSKGCSVGCWFCGFDAGPLEGFFPYSSQNRALWTDILHTCIEIFGDAAETGVCYYATEPSDNPDYLKFIELYENIMGVLPQTTSAAPLRNLDWTRELIRLCNEHHAITSRFSILNVKTLRQLHASFSPEELLRIQLIQQHKGSLGMKSRVGRALRHKDINRNSALSSQVSCDLGTIACVSGFVVNMADRTIRMVSPCRSSEKWPLGFRIHSQGTFNDAGQFKSFIASAIETRMPEHLEADEALGFRDDLIYGPLDDGFSLSTNFHSHRFSGGTIFRRIGDMVASANATTGEIMGDLIGEGADVFAVVGVLQSLFENGLLNDDLSLSTKTALKPITPG